MQHLFLNPSNTYQDIVDRMKEDHGFDATKSQYEARFKEWGWSRNKRKKDLVAVLYHDGKRRKAGKESEVYVHGEVMSQEKFENARRRYGIGLEIRRFRPEPSPDLPDGYSIRTPSPSPRSPSHSLSQLLAFPSLDSNPGSSRTPSPSPASASLSIHVRNPGVTIPGNATSMVDVDVTNLPSYLFERELMSSFAFGKLLSPLQFIPRPDDPVSIATMDMFADYSEEAFNENYSYNDYGTVALTGGHQDLEATSPPQNVSNSRNFYWGTALEWAVWNGQYGMLQTLLDYGADVDVGLDHLTQRVWELTCKVQPRHIEATITFAERVAPLANSEDVREFWLALLFYGTSADDVSLVQRILNKEGNSTLVNLQHTNIQLRSLRENGTTLLKEAVERDHLQLVELLLSKGADVDRPRYSGSTYLQAAAKNGNIPMALIFLRYGAQVNTMACPCEEMTALQAAAWSGSPEMQKFGATQLYRQQPGSAFCLTIYYYICPEQAVKAIRTTCLLSESRCEVLDILIEAGASTAPSPSLATRDSELFDQALHESIASAHYELVELLIEVGDVNKSLRASPRRCDYYIHLGHSGPDYKAPPCHCLNHTVLQEVIATAESAGIPDLIPRLINAGADVNPAGDFIYCSCLQIAIDNRHSEVTQFLLKRGAKPSRSSIVSAIHMNDVEVIRMLLNAGADPSEPGSVWVNDNVWGGRNLQTVTPLQLACSYGSAGVVKLLLDEGAIVDHWTDDEDFDSPLTKAMTTTSPLEIAQMVPPAGACVNRRGSSRNHPTPLQAAIRCIHQGEPSAPKEGTHCVVRFLLERGADVNAPPPPSGSTALQYAVENQDSNLVRLLLERGADVNAPLSATGRTPLQYAIWDGNKQLVNFLLEKGADVNAKPGHTHNEETAITLAAEIGHGDFVQLLLEKGAEVNSTADKTSGSRSLQAAAAKGFLGIARKLLAAGADPHARGNDVSYHSRPLQRAAESGHLDMCMLLIDAMEEGPAYDDWYEAVKLASDKDHNAIARMIGSQCPKVEETWWSSKENYETWGVRRRKNRDRRVRGLAEESSFAIGSWASLVVFCPHSG
ncbi:ankyrin repeat-containing domain protein [Zalerion maritima]|uniref:Ankyrin repeat-containing domain protein n=1 Tax=Zalerion maritima TaxID=339359 RepID=A0AAD5WNK0_9PEZI|nr:ankyrin repeat-containing domain protein [Zalerion maritima]